jgi:lysyl-tRNA synthetase, class II
VSRGLTYMSEMTHHSGPGPAEPVTGADEQRAEPAVVRGTDQRQQLRWVPLTAGLAALIIGLGYIAEGLLPGLYHRRLRGLSDLAPGTLANLTRTTDLIIGLLLLMLSHGLRRRKRRAWAAVMALLALGLIIHAGLGVALHHLQPDIPLPRLRPTEIIISAGLLIALYCFRRQFYAVGDLRSRWRALWVLGCLLAADIIIGMTYLSAIAKLKGTNTFTGRLQTVVQNLAGFTGPVQFAGSRHFAETQSDHFGFLMGGLGLFTLVVALFILLRPAEPAGRLRPADA